MPYNLTRPRYEESQAAQCEQLDRLVAERRAAEELELARLRRPPLLRGPEAAHIHGRGTT